MKQKCSPCEAAYLLLWIKKLLGQALTWNGGSMERYESGEKE
jgi:hypothetical protein